MSINAIGTYYEGLGILGGESSSSTENKQEVGSEEFLTLLVTQLKNQDPLNPLESYEFTAQLAQFNSLEQLIGVNERLAGIQEQLSSSEEEDFLELIGKTVKVNENTILVKEGSAITGSYRLEDTAAVAVTIYDIKGNEIRSMSQGVQAPGEYDIVWDGMDESGNAVEDGLYTFKVTAVDEAGNSVEADSYSLGEVTGVTYEYGVPYLLIGDKLVSSAETIAEVRKTVMDN